jgi:poly(A) polymerase
MAGFIAYLVGGSVRDLLLGHKPKDFDISTSAKPEEVKSIFRNSILIGRRFRLAHVRFGQKVIEVATFRSGDIENEALILRDNQWGYPEEDALRRDFTINGLFYDSSNQTIIDYVGGFEDIKRKVLRTIGQPFMRFKQDPVRMIRLLKFRARFGFDVDQDAHIALLECRAEITKSSQARVLEEFLRMLESGAAQSFVQLMSDHGLLSHLLPELAHFIEKPDGADIYSFLQEIDVQMHDPEGYRFDRSILLSALIYPLLEQRIKERYLDRELIPHLGQIQGETHQLIQSVFHGFFLLPRRLRLGMMVILTGQYRLTPLEKKRLTRRRIPSDPDFYLALEFLNLRSCLEPGLQVICEEWRHAVTTPESTAPRRKRRRRRKKKTP